MRRALAVLAATLALGACGTLPGPVAGLMPGAAAPALRLPEGAPRLRLRLPGQAGETVFARIAEGGGVATWASADGRSLAFRQGVLVGTRGFGHDLMGADVGGTLAALAGRGGGDYRRRMSYLDGENRAVVLELACRMAPAGKGLRETCAGPGVSFANLYIPAPGGGILRSAQWVSPGLGALALLPGR